MKKFDCKVGQKVKTRNGECPKYLTKIEFKQTITVEPIIQKETFNFLGKDYVVDDVEKLKKALEEAGVKEA